MPDTANTTGSAESAAAGKTRPPLATADQNEVERRALALFARDDVREICERVGAYWFDRIQPNPEHVALFEEELEQACFCGIMNAVNADPKAPLIHAFGRYAHELHGQHVPATKSGHPNPDYVYRFMPVEFGTRYVLRGKLPPVPPTAFEISLLTTEQKYLKNISIHELVTEADGSFVLTIDDDPEGSRPNHLPSAPGTYQLLVRDIFGDAENQRPVSLELERMQPADALARDPDAWMASCETNIRKHVDDLIWVNDQLVFSHEVNVFKTPAIHREGVYSVSQAYSAGHYRLADDEALVFQLALGGADYAVVPVSNRWGGLGPVLDRQVTLGTGSAVADPDGRYTFVVSHRDPGINNWVDPAGLHEGVIFVRWAGFRQGGENAAPALSARLAKWDELPAILPKGIACVDGETGRREQIERRRNAYRLLMG